MPIVSKSYTPATASATAVAAAQATTINVPMTLTAAAGTGIDTAGLGRKISIVSTGADGTIVFTVVGTDINGIAKTETITGVTTTPVVSTNYYNLISSITPSATTANLISVGTNGLIETPVLPQNFYVRTAIAVKVNITGTINYTVQECFEDILKPVNMGGTQTTDAIFDNAVTALTAKTANAYGQLRIGTTGMKIITASFTAGATLKFNVIEPSNSNLG